MNAWINMHACVYVCSVVCIKNPIKIREIWSIERKNKIKKLSLIIYSEKKRKEKEIILKESKYNKLK